MKRLKFLQHQNMYGTFTKGTESILNYTTTTCISLLSFLGKSQSSAFAEKYVSKYMTIIVQTFVKTFTNLRNQI